MLILSLQHIPKAKDTRFLKVKYYSSRPRPKAWPRPKGPEAEARGYEAEAEAIILASRPVWPRGFNISASFRSSIDTVALNCLVFKKIAFFGILATDRQTDRRTNRWTAPMH